MRKIWNTINNIINSIVTKSGFWLGLFLIGGIVLLLGVYEYAFPPLTLPEPAGEIVFPDQNWKEDSREKYYQTSQGTLIMPYSWFMSLEQAPEIFPFESNKDQMFAAPEHQARYRLIVDKHSKYNPDNLPVGIVKNTVRDEYVDVLGYGYKDWISISCAACHTGQISYNGTAIRIEGGQGMWDFSGWSQGLVFTAIVNTSLPNKFKRFAKRVLEFEGKEYTKEEVAKLRKDLKTYYNSYLIKDAINASFNHTYPTVEGGGRTAALGRGVNGEFGLLDYRNIEKNTGPVSYPPVWFTHDYDWVQSTAAIRQPLGRNVTEAWGVSVRVNLNPDSKDLFASTAKMHDMYWMETLLSIMDAPPWPTEIFGEIDSTLAERGRYLYEEKVWDLARTAADAELTPNADALIGGPNPMRPTKGLCARCHAPALEVTPNKWGKRYFQLPLYKLDAMGTDPDDAVQFNARVPYTGQLKDKVFNGQEKVGIGVGLNGLVPNIMDRWFKDEGITDPDSIAMLQGYRESLYRAPLGYPARPMAGYWATAPYLHNGGIKNMYELLGSEEERSKTFYLGTTEYDPILLGYVDKKTEGSFVFDTSIPGNSRAGHEFKDVTEVTPGVIGPALSHDDKMAIIEYMKVINDVRQDSTELARRAKELYDTKHLYEGKY